MVKIVTDTASDITRAQADALGVTLVPIGVQFKDFVYDPAQDEGFDEFYALLQESKDLPTTSQPPPAAFLDVFSEAKQQGDEVVVLLLSGALSGTVQSAALAKDLADYEKVYIIDTKSATLGERLLVEYAVMLRDEGKSAAEIAAATQDAVGRVKLFAAIDTLKYLRKGGRIPKTAEIVGTVMGIKPIITLDEEGKIVMAGKARGHAGAVTSLVKLMNANANVDTTLPVYYGYTLDMQPCHNFRKLTTLRYKFKNTAQYAVGPVVGTHIGPGGIAVVYLTKAES